MDYKNIVVKLFEVDNTDTNRRQKVFNFVDNFFQSSKVYQNILSQLLKSNKNNDFVSVNLIPKLMLIICQCLPLIDGKIENADKKYFIFSVLTKFVLDNDADFFSEFNVETFVCLYDSSYDLLEVMPEKIKFMKNTCCKK